MIRLISLKRVVKRSILLAVAVLALIVFMSLAFADVYELVAPSNNTFTNQQVVNFTVNVTFDGENGASLENITLWLSQDGVLIRNSTNVTTQVFVNNTFYNFSLILNEGVYNWTFSIGVDGTETLNTTNFTVTVDLSTPNVSIDVPADGTTQTGSILINASVNDTLSKVFNATFRLESATGTVTDWLDATLGAGDDAVGWWNVTFDTTSIADAEYNITINATDFAGNQNITNISRINIDNVADATTTTPTTTTSVSRAGRSTLSYEKSSFFDVAAGATKTITYTDFATAAVQSIEISTAADASISGGTLSVASLGVGRSLSSKIVSEKRKVYKYVLITRRGFSNEDLSSAKITFQVSASWINSNNIIPSTVKLNRELKREWTALPTTQISSDSNIYVYEAETPGFSIFAISGDTSDTLGAFQLIDSIREFYSGTSSYTAFDIIDLIRNFYA